MSLLTTNQLVFSVDNRYKSVQMNPEQRELCNLYKQEEIISVATLN